VFSTEQVEERAVARKAGLEVLAVIPARGGSVGVPSKNILPVAGKPVIAYTIDHARQSESVTRIAVSTDSTEIAGVARGCGAEIVMRPAEYATDTARIDYALRHALDSLRDKDGYRPDIVVLLYANIPVRDASITDRCVGHLAEKGGTSVRTFVDVGKFHPLWMSKIDGDQETPYSELKVFRRQDLPKLYIHDGACVAIRAEVLDLSRNHPEDNFAWLGCDRRGIVQESHSTVEIDSRYDLMLAEAIVRSHTPRSRRGSNTPRE
jgi:CMP-N-acetylneuraminic acid synthetase